MLMPEQETVGHAVAVFRESTSWYFFDPNYGEYAFPDPPDEVVSFISSLWQKQYGHLVLLC